MPVRIIYCFTLIIWVICQPLTSAAQKEGNIWYFGDYAGLDFNTLPPKLLLDGKLKTREGVATVSDANGKLLFYTEGTMIWDASHNVMPNGYGLMGNYTASQSAIAVPYPGHPGQYYVFTSAEGTGMRSSLVDMSLHNGLGDIVPTAKNISLIPDYLSTEKVMATKHCNNTDFWVISHSKGDNKFYVWPLTAAGLGTPQFYNIGQIIKDDTGWETIGCLKVSPDGQWLTHVKGNTATSTTSTTEIFKFDNQTGAITGPVAALTGLNQGYGMEYAPGGKLIYVTATNGRDLYQYDLTATDINASRVLISHSPTINYGSLQLAPDGQIYVAGEAGYDRPADGISIIHNPDVPGLACNFQENALSVRPSGAKLGLPTLMSSYVYDANSFTVKDTCLNAVTQFTPNSTANIITISWDFGDGQTSTATQPTHTYALAGTYTVTLKTTGPCHNNTVSRVIHILQPDLRSETVSLCNNNSYKLPDGRVVQTAGVYTSNLKNKAGCDSIITTTITLNQPYSIDVDTSVCSNIVFKLPDGRQVNTSGDYTSKFTTRFGCDSTIHTHLTVLKAYAIAETQQLCNGAYYTLPDGRPVNTTGVYTSSLRTTAGCDSIITTTILANQSYNVSVDTGICKNASILLPDGKLVTAAGDYTTVLTSQYGCDSIILTHVVDYPDYHINKTASICNGDSYLLPDGRRVAVSGIYTSNLQTQRHCDSIIITTLTVWDTYAVTEDKIHCPGTPYRLPDNKVVTQAGTYISRLQSVHGCDSIITTVLTDAPAYQFNDTQEICNGASVRLQDGTMVTQAGDYTVRYTTWLGCDSVFHTKVNVKYAPVINLGPDTCLFDNKPIVFSPGTGFDSYLWQDGSTRAVFTAYQAGRYEVTVKNKCGSSTSWVTVTECSPELFLPNAFSPNGDGKNDIFRILNYHGQQLMEFSIYNRWGECIFQTTDPKRGWNGTFHGQLQPVGSYVYQVRYRNMLGQEMQLKGTVALLL
ncbi:T9SS type B sorting domain-containing protein [Chitinophaga sp. G-6-1-13]|uniref:T9SS type B sorting domain-containing protein n=1 Tax=Chitinophaga fulva TaxID=2728842 RepID=A0A848GPC2_9BACT|nr:gliding motility-associated C-terminal domain-containing protein [Chitinophaga fulva]NML40445.1 T9SS type B sorting domain-containing protein [Chitinophaga fulva]